MAPVYDRRNSAFINSDEPWGGSEGDKKEFERDRRDPFIGGKFYRLD